MIECKLDPMHARCARGVFSCFFCVRQTQTLVAHGRLCYVVGRSKSIHPRSECSHPPLRPYPAAPAIIGSRPPSHDPLSLRWCPRPRRAETRPPAPRALSLLAAAFWSPRLLHLLLPRPPPPPSPPPPQRRHALAPVRVPVAAAPEAATALWVVVDGDKRGRVSTTLKRKKN